MAGQSSSNLNITAHPNGTTAVPIVLVHYAASNAVGMVFPMAAAGVNGAALGAVNRAAAVALSPPATTGDVNGPAAVHFLFVPVLLLQVTGHDAMAVGLLVFSFVLPPHDNDDDVHQVAAEPEQHVGMLLVDVDASEADDMDQLLDDMLAPYQTRQGGEYHHVDDVEFPGDEAAVEEAPEGRPWYLELEEDMSSIFDDFDIGREI